MAVFGKRPAAARPADAAPPGAVAATTPFTPFQAPTTERADSPTVGRILVPISALEAASNGKSPLQLVSAVDHFAEALLRKGHFVRKEIPPHALHAWHAHGYLAKVALAGHSHFIHDIQADIALTCSDALAGLTAVNAPHADILSQMMHWVASHPVEVGGQTGLPGGRAPFLSELDAAFREAEKRWPLAPALARWILTWPELMAVGDESYAETVEALCMANPKRRQRRIAEQLAVTENFIADRLSMSLGLALSALQPAELLVKLGPAKHHEADGFTQIHHHIHTDVGARLAVLTGDTVTVCEDLNGHPGRKLAVVDGDKSAFALQAAATVKAAHGIAAILHKMGHQGMPACLGPFPAETMHDGTEMIRWLVRCEDRSYHIDTMVRGAVASTLDDEMVLASINSAEIDAFATEFTAADVFAPQTDISVIA